MKIRAKSVMTFLLLSLIPLSIAASIAYKSQKDTIEKNLGSSFQQMAHDTMDKVDRYLQGIHQNVKTWAGLEFMQEVVTGDLDGKITSFLMRIKEEYGYFSTISALNNNGELIASSNPSLIGMNFKQKDFFKVSISGKSFVEDAHPDEINNEWVAAFSFPIMAEFETDRIIGVLCAKWKVSEISNMIQRYKEKGKGYFGHVKLMRGDGLVISAPDVEKHVVFKNNLIAAGLKSALLASQKKEGYLVEADEYNNKSLIGYDYSRGYGCFSGFGWFLLVNGDAAAVFSPIERLKTVIIALGCVITLIIIAVSFILSRKMTNPVLKIAHVAKKVAQGNFDCSVDYKSSDEIGSLTEAFNRMIRDLKEQKKQLVDKKELEMKNDELEELLGKLKESQSMLVHSEKMGAIGTMVAGVAHELNNPMMGIINFIQYCIENTACDDERYPVLQDAEKAVRICADIVDNLLTFSRTHKDGREGRHKTNCAEILERVFKLLSYRFENEQISIIKHYPDKIPEARVGESSIQQVFLNLVNNAMDALKESNKKEIHIGIGSEGEFVKVTVSDTGCGIDPQYIQNIFDPFFTTKPVGKGTGLGLSISHGIIDDHGGDLTCISKPGEGTEFKILLPKYI